MRLNRNIRRKIAISALVKWDEKNPPPNIKKAENDFANWLWERHFGKYSFDGIPKEFLKLQDRLSYSFQGEINQIAMSEIRPVNWNRYSTPVLEIFDKEPPKMKRYHRMAEKFTIWNNNRGGIEREIYIILESVGSVKKLVEIWPECALFLPDVETINLPTIPTTELNKSLGISTK